MADKAETELGIDPATVRRVRCGNSLWPGLACFTGVTFVVYLGVKAASGAVAVDVGFAAQMAAAGALAALGGLALARARYFYVIAETDAGRRRFTGLTRREQQALAARLSSKQDARPV